MHPKTSLDQTTFSWYEQASLDTQCDHWQHMREGPNIIAFGPSFPGQKGIAHKQDEYMDEQDLLANMEIYMNAMVALGQGKDD